jgi:hypothetical protein
MGQKSSTFVNETRDREAWLNAYLERESSDPQELNRLLGTAALVRGTLNAIPVSEDAEERSRAEGLAYMQELRANRLRQQEQLRRPWYLRFGSAMRYVFTLGKRR